MLLGPHGDRQKSVFNPKHYKTGLNLNHSVKLTICLKPPPELTDVVRVKTFRASFISSSCYTQGGFILFKWGSNFVVYSKGFFFSLGNRCQCLKLTCSLDLWRHLRGEARQAAWCRLLEISILHLKVALPHCCVSVSNLMLLIKKIPTWSKQWSPPPLQVSLRCILLTYMCHILFWGTYTTQQELHPWHVSMHTACRTGLWPRC